MNSEQDANQDLSEDNADVATDDSAEASDQAEAVDTDAGPLQRSQDALDDGREAARDALKDTLPDDEERNVDESAQQTEGD
jgi:hypothetical protein